MSKNIVAALSPKVIVGSPLKNIINIESLLKEVYWKGARYIVLPRLCLTSISFYDIDIDDDIYNEEIEALKILYRFSKENKCSIALSYIEKYDDKLVEEYIVIENGKRIDLDDYKGDIILYPSDIKEDIYVDKSIKNILDLSKKLNTTIVVASPSYTESTDKYVYGNISFIAKNGRLIDIANINYEYVIADIDDNKYIPVPLYDIKNDPYTFADHILYILAIGLYKRYISTCSQSFVLGLSGGIDSTFALLVLDKIRHIFDIDKDRFIIITMPSFGTSDRSLNNALKIAHSLDFNIRNIDIKNTCLSHLNDISHNTNDKNVTYENVQARIRTITLFDIANDTRGIVVGTGDMSEIALGWSTYGGDQLSNYNLNNNLPKTFIKKILNIISTYTDNNKLSEVLKDIIDMPISPELVLNQNTESILGPYEIIDYIMIHYLLAHDTKDKLIKDAYEFFNHKYDKNIINKSADTFFMRYYKNAFKRKASASGPIIGYPTFDYIPTDIER